MSEQLAALDAELDLNKQEVATTVVDDEQFKDISPIELNEKEELEED